jgi:hypothetical protein
MASVRVFAGMALLLAACEIPPPVIDTFPVAVSLEAGVPILGARAPEIEGNRVRQVVLDTASAVTVIDDGGEEPRRRRVALELLRFPVDPPVGRARFPEVAALLAPIGAVGAGAPIDVGGVIGGDVLRRGALRLDPSRGEIRFFPDIAGEDDTLASSCASVITLSLAGGDTQYVTGNDAVSFLPSKIVLGACLAPEPATSATAAGGDSLLVVATGVAPTLLSRTAYRRATGADDAAVDALPTVKIYLPYDEAQNGETARAATLPRLALVGRPHERRGPCAELAVSRLLSRSGGVCTDELRAAGCPCDTDNESSLCGAAATVDLAGEVEVAIVEDTHPLLQALRNELRPESAEIGGLLGMRALGPLVTDLDYPGGRVVLRCAAGADALCTHRPHVSAADEPALERAVELARCLD